MIVRLKKPTRVTFSDKEKLEFTNTERANQTCFRNLCSRL